MFSARNARSGCRDRLRSVYFYSGNPVAVHFNNCKMPSVELEIIAGLWNLLHSSEDKTRKSFKSLITRQSNVVL